MHHSRAPARGSGSKAACKPHIAKKSTKKFTTKKLKKLTTQKSNVQSTSPLTQSQRGIMNVWDDKESKEEIQTYADVCYPQLPFPQSNQRFQLQ